MSKGILVRTFERDCPICNEVHLIEERKKIERIIFKEVEVEFEKHYFICNLTKESENKFVSAELMDENLLRARNAYRIRKGLLTSNEIVNIRNKYNLSQSDFSTLLGWGEVTISRYENKTIQDETYDQSMRMVNDDPIFALEQLEKHKDKFSYEKYNKIKDNIKSKINNDDLYFKLKKCEVIKQYINYDIESDINGYKLLDIDKVYNIMGYFAYYINNLHKVKLMKLLWYSDVLNFKKYNKAMTGLVYLHMPYGALPIAFNEIICAPTILVSEEIIYPNGQENYSYKISPNPLREIKLSDFSFEELDILKLVLDKFKEYNTKDIVDYMHKEKAYINTDEKQIITYSLASHLNDFNK